MSPDRAQQRPGDNKLKDLAWLCLLLSFSARSTSAQAEPLPPIDCRDQAGNVVLPAEVFRPASASLKPHLIKRVSPPPPKGKFVQRINIIELAVDPQGRVCNSRLLKGAGDELSDLWVAATRSWRFEPPRENGKPVALRMAITAYFEPF